jgi:hypothetical protein
VTARAAVLGGLAVLAAVALGSYAAGEQREVVVLYTRDELGKEWASKMWVVDLDDVVWVRVANPRRAWYQRLLADPKVELERGGRREPRLALPDRSPEAREMVDEAFAAKYGWVDRWYGLLLRRDPVPIRLATPVL